MTNKINGLPVVARASRSPKNPDGPYVAVVAETDGTFIVWNVYPQSAGFPAVVESGRCNIYSYSDALQAMLTRVCG